MATKNRLMCYKNKLVLITNKRVSKIFNLDANEVEHEIDKIIEKGGNIQPIQIFKKAVENLLLGYTFGDIRRKNYIYGEEICIHDQVYYRRYLEYILNNEIIKRKQEIQRENDKKRREFIEKNIDINEYKKTEHKRVIKYLRGHYYIK